MRKPIVRYKPTGYDNVELDKQALIAPMTHTSPYVSNTRYVITSTVVRIGENGEFETKNSIYRPI